MTRALLAAAVAAMVTSTGGGCGDRADSAATAPPRASARPVVIATNLPLAAFAQLIGGDAVDVVLPPPADVDPAFWKPSAEDVARMQQAAVILVNGAAYERWLPTVTLPQSRVVDTTAAFRTSYIELPDETTHSHGPAGAHSHKGMAFTTWIDFDQAAKQAQAVSDALRAKVPTLASDAARHRADELVASLQSLAARTQAAGVQLAQQPVWGSHPVYDYLARRASLNMKSVHWEPGEVPTAEQLKEFDSLRSKHAGAIMLWEDQPLPETVRLLADRGVKCVVFAPMANDTDRSAKSWLQAMDANVTRLEDAARAVGAKQK